MTKRALILGIGGQDGSYLADLLVSKGYEVHGLYRRTSVDNLWRIKHLLNKIQLHCGDITDPNSLHRVLQDVKPHELYNEADQDHVGTSFQTPKLSMDVTAGGVLNVLESVKACCPDCKVFQPTSATIFGDALPPQTESTSLNPLSPYACAKAHAYYLARYYRQVYNLHVSTSILYNHDSTRRSGDYLLHNIAKQAIAVSSHQQSYITIGNPDMSVDIGYAPDYCEGIYKILQQSTPDDYILASGPTTIRNLISSALEQAGVDEPWSNPKIEHDPTGCMW